MLKVYRNWLKIKRDLLKVAIKKNSNLTLTVYRGSKYP